MKFHHNRCMSDQDVRAFILHLETLGYYSPDWDWSSEGSLVKFEYVCGKNFACLYAPNLNYYKIILVEEKQLPEGVGFMTEGGVRIPIA